MLQFKPRTNLHETAPLGELPLWESALLRARGVDTAEAAERFLRPSLGQLHDPLRMQGMGEAVRLLREAAETGEQIAVYGDYDCDGVCASAIMLETLGELGAQVRSYIPDRHREGYGLNIEAVRQLAAEGCRLLMTVDCGITNAAEVAEAQRLGMRVIVSDHHQLGEEIPPAEAVLNPLMGDYPFRRLCGAGVALKVTQALLGMAGVERRLELAALATVADLVPLIDENRVIVAEGLRRMADPSHAGLAALMAAAQVTPPVNSGQIAFRLAPRINAGGRLADARRCVTLLTTRDADEAARIASELEGLNSQRQAMQDEITRAAERQILERTDFFKDRVLLAMGAGWESGIVGLAAGKLCERYHFPVIVLSENPETGLAVGSCRSIPGVNIHLVLSSCADLFTRFGGHEQAAGLTMPASKLPELRERLNAEIDRTCDRACYIPAVEYDQTLSLGEVSLELADMLALFEPTGLGNPAPTFLVSGAQVGQMRAVGKTGDHLKLVLTDGRSRVDGIAFGQGALARQAMAQVDAVFAPTKNEYMGRVTPQMQIKALRPGGVGVPIPSETALFRALVQELTCLAENYDLNPPLERPVDRAIRAAQVRDLLADGMGVLLLAHGAERVRELLALAPGGRLPDLCEPGTAADPRSFNSVMFSPTPELLRDQWRHIVLADGELLPGERAMLERTCPRAQLHRMEDSGALRAKLRGLVFTREEAGALYRLIRSGGDRSLNRLCDGAGLPPERALLMLEAMREAGLITFRREPWTVELIPVPSGFKSSPLDAPVARLAAQAAGGS